MAKSKTPETTTYGVNAFCRPGDLPGNYGISRCQMPRDEDNILAVGKEIARAANIAWPCDSKPTINWLKHVNVLGACALRLGRSELQSEYQAAVADIKAGRAPYQTQAPTAAAQDAEPESPPELAEDEQSIV